MQTNDATAWHRATPTRNLRESSFRRLAAAGFPLALAGLTLVALILLQADSLATALRLLTIAGLSTGLGAAITSWWPSSLDPLTFFETRPALASTARHLGLVLEGGIQPHLLVDTAARSIDARDPDTYGHCRRVSELASVLAAELGMDDADRQTLVRAALLHDIGKLGVPDSTLHKTAPLTEEDSAAIRQHPDIGYRMLEGLNFLGEGLAAIRCHHERFDGSGYPNGLAGAQIPPMARILAVADAYDAITSDRPYRPARSKNQGIEEIVRCAGSHFDPAVVAALTHAMRQGLLAAPLGHAAHS